MPVINSRRNFRYPAPVLPFILVILSLACSLPTIGRPAPTSPGPAQTATPPPPPTPTPQPLPPALIEVDPPPGAEIPLAGPVTLFFNQPMDRLSVEAALASRPEAARFTWRDDATLVYTPAEPLPPESELSFSLAAGARSAQGLALSQPITLTFTTAGYLRVSHVLPDPDAAEVDPTSAVVASFNRPVVPLGAGPENLPVAFNLSASNAPTPPGRGEWINTSTYIFYPDPALQGGTTYTVQIDSGLHGADGSPLQGQDDLAGSLLEWTFTTALPRLVSMEPASGSRSLGLDDEIILTFNQPMDPATTEANFNLFGPNATLVPGEYSWNEDHTILTFKPTGLLSRSTFYNANLSNQAQGAGGTLLVSSHSATLQTVPVPAITGSTPVQGGILNAYDSVVLYFSAPIQQANLDQSITISPTVPNLYTWWDEEDLGLRLSGDFSPSTDYSLTVSAELADVWDTPLGQPFNLNFRTAPLEPGLLIPNSMGVLFVLPQEPSLVAQATNFPQVSLTVGSLPLSDFFNMLTGDQYTFLQNYQPADARNWVQALSSPPDRSQPVEIQLTPDQSPLAPGLYYLRVTHAQPNQELTPYLIVASNIQLTFKYSATEAMVWAVDLRTDQPLPDAPVRIYGPSGALLAEGQTGRDGVLHLEIPVLENPYDTLYAILGEPGQENFSMALSTWNQGLNGWDFGIRNDVIPPRLKTYIYSDRPIYQPGQTVYFRVVARQAYNGRYSLPDLGSLPLTLYSDNGEELTSFDLPLSAYGTAHGQYTLPEGAPPGYYRLTSPAAEFDSLYFQVALYRKPEINLQVAFAADQILAGQTLTATVNARYFFDAPAGNVNVHWALYAAPTYFELPEYQVGPEDIHWIEPFQSPFFGGPFGEILSEGDAQTGPDGMLSLDFPTGEDGTTETGISQRQRYTLEVTVRDESEFPVSARASAEVNPAEFYIGVRPDSWMGRANEQLGFEIQVVDWQQNPAGARSLRAEFLKVTWVRQDPPPGAPFAVPNFTPEYSLIGSTDFTTGEHGQARLAFTPLEPGTTLIRVAGEGAYTGTLVWVGGPGQATWPNLVNQRLRLNPDRAAYRPGDTAQVFIPNPFGTQVLALVTLERGVVLGHEVMTVEAGGRTLSLPLSAEEAPNVYLSVTLLGRSAEGRPDYRHGYLNLPVEPVEQSLSVSLSNRPQRTGPGEEVTFDLLVTDAFGNPAQGEFTLSVVDLATLALADPNAPDIVSAFYAEQPLGVRTGMALTAYTHLQGNVNPVGGGGGGGDFLPPIIRERFPDTAYWNAEIITGPDGKARASLLLPDNLTTWQVEARGVTAATLVGQAQSQVITTKDLLVRPVTPRFLVVGDHTRLAAIVQNNTAGTLPVDVALQGSGFILDEPAAANQQVNVPAGGRARVEWWGTAQEVEAVDLVFSARSGSLEDATRLSQGTLPILRYTAQQTFSTSGSLEAAGERLELVSLPRSFDPGGGELSVVLSPSLVAAILDALEALENHPYENTEQTLSRFLPNLEAYRTLQQFGVQSPALQTRLDRNLNEGLQRLLARQTFEGGWSWWQGGENDPYITAYVLFGLSRAREAGIAVPDGAIQRAEAYLRAGLPTAQMLNETWQLDRLAFEYFALAAASQEPQSNPGDLSGAEALYQERAQLSSWAQALLALALERLSPDSQPARTLVSDLQSAAVRSATGAHWETGEAQEGGRQNMITTLSNSAIVVYALAQRDPGSPLLADAVRYLMAHRQADGAWSSTYATAWTLMALTEVMRGTGEMGGNFAFNAALNGVPLASGQAGGAEQLNPVTASAALTNLYPDLPNALNIQREAGPGRLYYTAALHVSQPVESVAPLARGLSITRLYYPAGSASQLSTGSTGCPLEEECQPVQSARAGELVTARLTLTVPNDVYYLLVEDFIPAGAEILDASLKTSQQGAGGAPATEQASYDPRNPYSDGWGWWYFHNAQVYADHIAWAADYLPAGTYELTYTLVITQPGEYRVLPARAWQFYFPEVQANSAGTVFEIEP